MRLLLRTSLCAHGLHLTSLKLTRPRVLWLEHRLALSTAHRRRRQSPGVKSPVHPVPSPPRWPFTSVLSCRGLSVFCPHSQTGRARTATHAVPVAFASSSSSPDLTPEDPLKTDRDKAPTTVPLQDVRRILKLAHPERWRLAGKHNAKPQPHT